MQLLKINSNSAEEVARLRGLEKDWQGALKKVTFDVMELSRKRFLQQLGKGGVAPNGNYQPLAGADVPKYNYRRITDSPKGKRRYRKELSGEKYFFSKKLVSRTGRLERLFNLETPGLIREVKQDGGKTIGYFGVSGGGGYRKGERGLFGSVEAIIAANETGVKDRKSVV